MDGMTLNRLMCGTGVTYAADCNEPDQNDVLRVNKETLKKNRAGVSGPEQLFFPGIGNDRMCQEENS